MSRRKSNRETDESKAPENSLCLCDKPGCRERAKRVFEFSRTSYVYACNGHDPDDSPLSVHDLPDPVEPVELDPDDRDNKSEFQTAGELW